MNSRNSHDSNDLKNPLDLNDLKFFFDFINFKKFTEWFKEILNFFAKCPRQNLNFFQNNHEKWSILTFIQFVALLLFPADDRARFHRWRQRRQRDPCVWRQVAAVATGKFGPPYCRLADAILAHGRC